MVFSTIALVVAIQEPKSFEDIEIEKIKAYHGLRGYREVFKVHFARGDDASVATRTTELEETRFRTVIEAPDGSKVEEVFDGVTTRKIMHGSKLFFDAKLSLGDKSKPFDPKEQLERADPDSLKFSFATAGTPIRFASDPPLVIKLVETVQDGSEKTRKVVASSTSKSGRVLTITQWFLPDKWILKRFSIEGAGESGPVDVEGKAVKLEFGVKFGPNHFILDPATISGYKKVDPPQGNSRKASA